MPERKLNGATIPARTELDYMFLRFRPSESVRELVRRLEPAAVKARKPKRYGQG